MTSEPKLSRGLEAVDPGDSVGPLAFNTVFDQYVRYVHAIAQRLMGDEGDAEDVVQEVFWSCSKHIRKLKSMTHARRWLVRVTVQKARRQLRKRKMIEALHLSYGQSEEAVGASLTASERAALVQLFSLLRRMPVNRRLAWSLRYLEGASLQETADALGCSLATVKRWIAAAQLEISGGDNG